MLASLILSLREGLEAALVVSILLAALRKTKLTGLIPVVWRGIAAAIGVNLVAGLVMTWLGAEFQGRAEQIFEGTAMLAAALMLTWMIIWMRRQSVNLQKDLESGISQAAGQGNKWGLFWLSFLAVGREGLELVLFLAAARMTSTALQTTLGAVLGLSIAIVLGWGLFASSKRLNLRQFFNVTNILLIFFAAGLVANGIHEFNEAGIIPALIEPVWDLNPVLNENQPIGQLLTALFGYNANPSLTECLGYLAYFIGLGIVWKKLNRMSPRSDRT
jgi:high-affinity iron transporter